MRAPAVQFSGVSVLATVQARKSAKGAQSSPEKVIDAITRGIEAGRYVPGQRLVEADLTRELGVSRGPVREAFKRLSGEGVLVLTRHRGAFIRAMNREEVRDVLTVLESLTGLAARLAARRIDESGNREAVQEAFERLQAYEETGETLGFLAERRRFYNLLIQIGDNHELARLMPQLQISLLRLQFLSFITLKQHQNQIEELRTIVDAILAGDGNGAERATRLHLRRRRVSLTTLPDEAYAAAE